LTPAAGGTGNRAAATGRLPSRALTAAALLAAACAAAPQGPPAVRWGVDECSHCHMILSDPRFAAVARGAAGAEARFDDLGCLVAFLGERGGDQARRDEGWQVWVHDAGGEGWLPAAEAWYTRGSRLATPMGSGLRAWPSREAAAPGGEPLPWTRVRDEPALPPT
jgi:copper chaperone NosL